MAYLDYSGLRYFLTRLNSRLSGKLDRVQSSSLAGRLLTVGQAGNVTAGVRLWTGPQAEYDAQEKSTDTLYCIVGNDGVVTRMIYRG